MRFYITKNTLLFKQRAGTSRGTYTERKVWYVTLSDDNDPEHKGVGECAPLPKLSCDDLPDEEYEKLLMSFANETATNGFINYESLKPYPSILFGLETALWHYNRNTVRLSDTSFSKGQRGIRINGLIWMGTFDEMKHRIEEKLNSGYNCVKLKIGAIDFDDELNLIKKIRESYSKDVIELRVDANGAFKPGEDALGKLEQLSKFGIHSIEQPIMAGQWDSMAELCRQTPLPIALDEELIGINDKALKSELIESINPQYIILKPSLHGGINGGEEWIELAQTHNIGWWITSALESNVGLNAIAHWCAMLQEGKSMTGITLGTPKPTMPQGLGTGQLFVQNIPYPLNIETRSDGIPALYVI